MRIWPLVDGHAGGTTPSGGLRSGFQEASTSLLNFRYQHNDDINALQEGTIALAFPCNVYMCILNHEGGPTLEHMQAVQTDSPCYHQNMHDPVCPWHGVLQSGV